MNVVELSTLVKYYASMKERTEVEEASYKYCDRALTYLHMKEMAFELGNKNPDNNFMVKNALKLCKEAERELKDLLEKAKAENE